jgi:hypothetical protein
MKILYGEGLVNELRRNSESINERLWIAVPYIGGLESVKRILGREWIDNSKLSVRLITDIDEGNNFSSETIDAFYKQGEIRNLPGLHAKIYITDNKCLITSANLTHTAFSKRHEIGIYLEGKLAQKSISIFEKWWKKSETVLLENLKPILKKKIKSEEERKGVALPILWELPEEPNEITYWLKPIGATDDKIKEDRIFNQLAKNLYFSTPSKTPRVNIGDIFIEYGVGARRILSVYQSTSLPERVTKNDIKKNVRLKRWPWYVEANNLTIKFGSSWQKHNLYAKDLVHEYLKRNPDALITVHGSKNLNAIQHRKDKIRLQPAFAKFVIRKVTNINDKLDEHDLITKTQNKSINRSIF